MSTVAIEKSHNVGSPASIFDEIEHLAARIRQRAFEIFEARGRTDGFDTEDWLNAEKELICCPESEFSEKDQSFEILVAMPGFQADEIHVTALPDELIVKAESTHENEDNKGDVQTSEFGRRTILRRFSMPETVDIERIAAHLENGKLHLIAPKAASSRSEDEKKTAEPEKANSAASSTATAGAGAAKRTATASRS